jgi:hypothetical protein
MIEKMKALAEAIGTVAGAAASVINFLNPKEEDKSEFEKGADKVIDEAFGAIGSTFNYLIAPLSKSTREKHGGFGGFDKSGKFIREGAKSNATAAARIPTGAGSISAGGNTSTTSVTIGNINVQTQATDAKGIASGIGKAIRNNGLINLTPHANGMGG